MENSFFYNSWRRDKKELSEEELNLPLGKAQLILINKLLISSIIKFIEDSFGDSQIKVSHKIKQDEDENVVSYSSQFKNDNIFTEYHFGVKIFDEIHEYYIENIPASKDAKHIKIFLDVIKEYVQMFGKVISSNLEYTSTNNIAVSQNLLLISDALINNLKDTIVIEYIYSLFNYYNEEYEKKFSLVPKRIRYNMDIINKIYEFSKELATRKIENKEIYTGFIFHDSVEQIQMNSKKVIEIETEFEFANFNKLKQFLEITNGQNIFFNVTNNIVTHIFITKEKIQEVALEPLSKGKTFSKRPLIVSIQGTGKIVFLEGRNDKNKILLQIIDNKPILKDDKFIKNYISDFLKNECADIKEKSLSVFVDWILSLALKKHGTSIVVGDFDIKIEEQLVKSVKIKYPDDIFQDDNLIPYDIELLNNLIKPDGAIIFNNLLHPFLISTILPFTKSENSSVGGARHNSMKNFTEKQKCVGIVISEDGPISIFKNGQRIMKF